jgi:prepilin-type N-terminal cleavage/methylation domain-containing protein
MSDFRKGFTLIEMLAVTAIILILAGLSLTVGKYAKNKAARSKAEAQLAKFVAGYQRYMGDMGRYPGSASTETPVGANDYVDTSAAALTDPWGVVYRYRIFTNGGEFVIGSFGPDMKPGIGKYDDDRYDLLHPWRTNGIDVSLWTEFGYGDDIVKGDCRTLVRLPPLGKDFGDPP